MTSVDLEKCYDRIIHVAAALALLSIGVPHARIHSMFESIQKMMHRVRTALDDSDITYGSEDIGDCDINHRMYYKGIPQVPIFGLLLALFF